MIDIPFKSPLVVGYKGEVGSFLLSGLLKIMPKALNIWCFDINESPMEREHRIKVSDYIFLCVPIQDTVDWLIQNKSLLLGKVIIEQCSLKSPIYENLALKDLDIRSMHLLFRPSATPNYSDRRCAIISLTTRGGIFGSPPQLKEAVKEMTNSSLVFYGDYQEHDKAMAIQQALIHRILLTAGELFRHSGSDTYVSRKISELIERIKTGDKILYAFIQQNKELPTVLDLFKKSLEEFDFEHVF